MDEMYKDIYKKLMTLQWLLRRYQMMNCKEHNIYENRNEGQGRVLALLKIQPEIATKDMAYLLGIKQQSLNELLKKLEKSGYVKRKPSKEDKRVMIVCLTNEELEQFSSYIDRILSSLEEMVGNPLDQEAYEWMERIQSHMGREQFEKVVEEQLQKIFQGQNVFLQIMMTNSKEKKEMNSKNENYWLLEAPVSKAIWHMAIPMMLGMSVNMIYNLTDTFLQEN